MCKDAKARDRVRVRVGLDQGSRAFSVSSGSLFTGRNENTEGWHHKTCNSLKAAPRAGSCWQKIQLPLCWEEFANPGFGCLLSFSQCY